MGVGVQKMSAPGQTLIVIEIATAHKGICASKGFNQAHLVAKALIFELDQCADSRGEMGRIGLKTLGAQGLIKALPLSEGLGDHLGLTPIGDDYMRVLVENGGVEN